MATSPGVWGLLTINCYGKQNLCRGKTTGTHDWRTIEITDHTALITKIDSWLLTCITEFIDNVEEVVGV